MKRRKRRPDKGAPKWMVTYSDMVTLVLVFFILLFSMSQIDLIKFDSITKSFQSRNVLDFLSTNVPLDDRINVNDGVLDELDDGGVDGSNQDEEIDVDHLMDQLEEWEQKADALAKLMENVEAFLAAENLENVISANRTEEGVILVLQDSILFDPAEAEILDSGKPFLNEVGNLLEEIPNQVRIEGHTDSRPINTYRYPSNWELSGARASSVIRYLVDNFDLNEERFSLAGYGEIKPIEENDTPENMAKNRRVEIVILDANSD